MQIFHPVSFSFFFHRPPLNQITCFPFFLLFIRRQSFVSSYTSFLLFFFLWCFFLFITIIFPSCFHLLLYWFWLFNLPIHKHPIHLAQSNPHVKYNPITHISMAPSPAGINQSIFRCGHIEMTSSEHVIYIINLQSTLY